MRIFHLIHQTRITNFLWRLGFVTMVVLTVLPATSAMASERPFLSVEKLMEDLNTENLDLILEDLNAIPSMKYRGQILPFLQDLWNHQTHKYPSLPWDTIDTPIVQIYLADILLQAHENGYIHADRPRLRQFILHMLQSSDTAVKMQALKAALFLDDPQAIRQILAVAQQQERWTFRLAVFTLAKMCHPAAYQALTELAQTLSTPEPRQFVRTERDRAQKNKGRQAWCASKANP